MKKDSKKKTNKKKDCKKTTTAVKPAAAKKTTPAAKAKTVAPADKAQTKKQQDLVIIIVKTHPDKNGGHPHAVLGDIDNNYISVGFTRDSKKGKNSTNYKLEINPLGGNDQSYMRRQGTVNKKEKYTEPKKGKMTQKDFAKATEYGEKAKQKYINKKGQKDKKK